jgi:hypothetical protein
MLRVDGPSGELRLDRERLRSLADDDAAERAGRFAQGMPAVRVSAVLSLVDAGAATHATFHAADGYAASIPLEQAAADGLILVPEPGDPKPGVRLVVTEGRTACLNVKAVERLELTVGQGKHTVNPNPHEAARVPGWDE